MLPLNCTFSISCSRGAPVGRPLPSLWRDLVKGFHPALLMETSLWWCNCPYARHIICKREKEAVNNKIIFPSACLPRLWKIASRQWGESECLLSEQTQRSQGQLMQKFPCPHSTRFMVFYILSVMLGERKTLMSDDIISYWSKMGFPQVIYHSEILNLIKCSSFWAQLDQVRYGCHDMACGSMKRDV